VEYRGGRRAFGGRAGIGVGGFIVVLVLGWLMGVNPLYLMGLLQEGGEFPSARVQTDPSINNQNTDFVRAILGDTEDTWSTIFQRSGQSYKQPKLVLFTGAVQSACGFANAAVGPFYCSRDEEVYLDLSFFEDLSQRFGAPGDFARAYVIAHEVGHHIQHFLGISAKVQAQRARADEATSNAMSVRQELQADCFAGVWGHYTAKRGLVDRADIAAALNAAAQIGDDRLQKRAQGYVVPEAFTHGSAAQRMQWLKKGLESGDPNQCNTWE
jgi:predicted metalloprotease